MTVKRSTFFLALFCLAVLPFPVMNAYWLLRSVKTIGIVRFTGKEISGQMTKEYAVVTFKTGNQTIWFNGYDDVLFPRHEVIPVRYQPAHPEDARIGVFTALWADTLVSTGIAAVIFLILWLHPAIVPWHSKLKLTIKKPFIRIA
jgi:hypothetical protein